MWDLIKIWMGPGTLTFLILFLTLGILLARSRSHRRLGRNVVGVLIAFYLVLSLPLTAGLLARALMGACRPLTRFGDMPRPVSIVLLGGDHPDDRVRETVRLHGALHPQSVVVSGDRDLFDAVVAAGIPADEIVWDDKSGTTRAQAVNLGPVLRAHGIAHFVLVASPIHMRRALGAVRAAGLDPIPSISEVPRDWTPTGLASVVPQWRPLKVSEDALYEYLALAYYHLRGWIK